MANKIYPLAKEALLNALFGDGLPGGADAFIIGVTSGYVYSDTDSVLADVDEDSIVAPEVQLANLVVTGGVVSANNPALEGMTLDATLAAFVIYAKWGAESLLLAYMDTAGDGTIPHVISSELGVVEFPDNGIFGI